MEGRAKMQVYMGLEDTMYVSCVPTFISRAGFSNMDDIGYDNAGTFLR